LFRAHIFAPVRQKSGNRTLNDRFGPFLATKHLSSHDKSNIRGNPAKSPPQLFLTAEHAERTVCLLGRIYKRFFQ
jgi:hypothetical protein